MEAPEWSVSRADRPKAGRHRSSLGGEHLLWPIITYRLASAFAGVTADILEDIVLGLRIHAFTWSRQFRTPFSQEVDTRPSVHTDLSFESSCAGLDG